MLASAYASLADTIAMYSKIQSGMLAVKQVIALRMSLLQPLGLRETLGGGLCSRH